MTWMFSFIFVYQMQKWEFNGRLALIWVKLKDRGTNQLCIYCNDDRLMSWIVKMSLSVFMTWMFSFILFYYKRIHYHMNHMKIHYEFNDCYA